MCTHSCHITLFTQRCASRARSMATINSSRHQLTPSVAASFRPSPFTAPLLTTMSTPVPTDTIALHHALLTPASRIPSLPDSINYIPSFISPAEEASLIAHISRHPWTHLAHRKLQAHPGPLSPAGALLAAPLPAFLQPLAERIAALGVFDERERSDDEAEQGEVKRGGAEKGEAEQDKEEQAAERAETNPRDAAAGIDTGGGTARRRGTNAPGAPNHVLINAYAPGQGIHAHEDGPAYAATVATVSLGGSVVLDVAPRPAAPTTATPPTRPRQAQHATAPPSSVPSSASGTTTTTQQDPTVTTATPQRILQPPRSLLVTRGAAYTTLLHGIAGVRADADLSGPTVANWALLSREEREAVERVGGVVERGPGERISLTFRRVLKVRRVGGGVLGRLGGRR